jgi:hypothetical protein
VWDAANVGGWYTFVGNSPVSMVDPLGLQQQTPIRGMIPSESGGWRWPTAAERDSSINFAYAQQFAKDNPNLYRWSGAGQVLGASLQMAGGLALLAVPEPMATKVAGGATVAFGFDNARAGFAKLFGDPDARTLKNYVLDQAFQGVGLDPNAARDCADWSEILLEFVTGRATGRAASAAARQFSNVDEILANPSLLSGLRPEDVIRMLGGRAPSGWQIETLGRGAHKGQGWVLRQYTTQGNPTGRQLRWHPGGGHHGPESYWRVIDANAKSGIIR